MSPAETDKGITYRAANISDALELAKLRYSFQMEDAEAISITSEEDFVQKCSDFIEKEFESRRLIAWVAEKNEQIIAHAFVQIITMIPKPSRIHDQYGYLTNVFTKPSYRNQGIGQQLLNHLIKWARAQDLELLIVWPSEQSFSFYEKSGFSPAHEIMELTFRDEE